MPAKLTNETFKEKANNVHNGFYGYSKVIYDGMRTNVIVTCPVRGHGDFPVTPETHLSGAKCRACSYVARGEARCLGTEKFKKMAHAVHGDRYDYSKSVYKKAKSTIVVICKDHDEFTTTPDSHVRSGSGCPDCANSTVWTEEHTTIFIKKANKKHNKVYTYGNVVYRGNKNNVLITCVKPGHGDFSQTPDGHLAGRGCRKCKSEKLQRVFCLTQDEFITKSRAIHGDRYGYSKVVYVNNHTAVSIYCKKHGIYFPQVPMSHLAGNGCPTCSESHGERKVGDVLKTMGYKNVQRECGECMNPNTGYRLPYDFMIKIQGKPVFVEYHGEQHYKRVKCFHKTEQDFINGQMRDAIKMEYARTNGIPLIEIRYDEDTEMVLRREIIALRKSLK